MSESKETTPTNEGGNQNIEKLIEIVVDLTKEQLLKEGAKIRSDIDLCVYDVSNFVRKRLKRQREITLYCTVKDCHNFTEISQDSCVGFICGPPNFVCNSCQSQGFATDAGCGSGTVTVYVNNVKSYSYPYEDYFKKGRTE
jgi:hypothetical protein